MDTSCAHFQCQTMLSLQGGPGYRLWSRWVLRLQLAQQAAAAIAYMHEANIIHRDVTANNILVTENYEAKVRVFGVCRQHTWCV